MSTAPTGNVTGPVTVAWAGGAVALGDGGTDGDLEAGDGVYTRRFNWVPPSPGLHALDVSAVVDGKSATSQVEVAVYEDWVPIGLYRGEHAYLEHDGTIYCADMLDLLTEPGADPRDVADAVAAVGGQIAGTVLLDTWEILMPAAADWAGLHTVLGLISQSPIILGAEPVGMLSVAGAVEPNDLLFSEQEYLQAEIYSGPLGVADAWAFNTGRIRTNVAVIDTGAQLDHPDLAGSIAGGYDYVDQDDHPYYPGGDACASHGTQVSGIIGATANNGEGIAGINWNVNLLEYRVAQEVDLPFRSPVCTTGENRVAAAIDQAVADGAKVINISQTIAKRNETIVKSLQNAWRRNVVVVAAAGNGKNDMGTDEKQYPAAYGATEMFSSADFLHLNQRFYTTDVLSIGSTDRIGLRSTFSNYGDWVDFYAPGEYELDASEPSGHRGMLTTSRDGTYIRNFGTSLSAPFVAGVASLIMSDPSYVGTSTSVMRKRLLSSSERRAPAQQGRIIDAYQAVSNASFESGLATLQTNGTVTTEDKVGEILPILPRHGEEMLQVSTGPGAAVVTSSASLTMSAPPDALSDDSLMLCFWYDFVTEEYREYVGSRYNDKFTIDVVLPNGTTRNWVTESVNTTAWTPLPGDLFPGGDRTAGHSGWQFACRTLSAADLRPLPPSVPYGGRTTVKIVVSDVGDAIYDSVGLIDDIWVF
ncbi:MAG: S8 family serine peptidase [Bifidobacteriaceae bacterium]|nr:S8 family serine peptidase [Bifidobacteriaceae bacterium]